MAEELKRKAQEDAQRAARIAEARPIRFAWRRARVDLLMPWLGS